MKLTNLKMTKKEIEAQYELAPEDKEAEKYPWGTRLHLDAETVEKLGLQDCEAGEEVEVAGMAVVRSVSVHQREGGSKQYSVDLQMTDMAAQKLSGPDPDGLYPSMKES